MRLLSYRYQDQDRIGALVGDSVILELSHLVPDAGYPALSLMRRLISVWDDLGKLVANEVDGGRSSSTVIGLDEVEILPVVPDPSKVIAAPVNYIDHMQEMSQDAHIDALGVFLKAPSSVIGHSGTVVLPYRDRRFDQEGELAVVIGRRSRHLTIDEAHDAIFGYLPLLDITMRGGEDRSTRKSFDTFTPIGPTILTKDEVADPKSLELRCWVNDSLRQRAQIADLIWGIPELVSYASSVMTLEPGDIVTTGTPAGVGPIADNDVVRVEIDQVGALAVAVSSDGAIVSPTRGAGRGPVPPPPIP